MCLVNLFIKLQYIQMRTTLLFLLIIFILFGLFSLVIKNISHCRFKTKMLKIMGWESQPKSLFNVSIDS